MRTRVAASALVLLTLGSFLPAETAAQVDLGSVSELWLDYNPSVPLTPTVDLYGDVGYRVQLESSGSQRLVVRPNARYRWSRSVSVQGGIGSFFTWNEAISNLWEIRPWVGVTVLWPDLPFRLEHVVRLEGRFEYETEDWDLRESLRLRYRLRGDHRWAESEESGRYWRVLGSIELFGLLGGTEGLASEQVRLVAGLEHGHNPAVRSRVEATFQKAGRLLGEGSFDQLIIRLRLFHALR